MRAIEILGSLANVAPVFDYVNFDNLVKHLAEIVGVPQKILKSQSQVNAERQQAQQQQQEKCNRCNKCNKLRKQEEI